MAAYIMGQDVAKMSKANLMNLHQNMDAAYPGWEDLQKFTREIRQEKFGEEPLAFNQILVVLASIGEKHGTWQQKECLDMKQQLTALENVKDGCVPLATFYKGMREE